jgi:phosphopantothenoylcysteine decarboxylase
MINMKKIILGVTGSVAAIKISKLAEQLQKLGEVRIVITEAADYFVRAERSTLKKLDIPIYRDCDEWPVLQGTFPLGEPILHIEMRRWADCMLVAPLDANTLAKIAHGMCDNLLTSIIRAWDWTNPLFLCPAMNTMMWNNNPTSKQVNHLKSWGATIIEPIEKRLACNDIGMGAMADITDIFRIVSAKRMGMVSSTNINHVL